MATATETPTTEAPEAPQARGSRRKVQWNGVEITERQKEIMELSEQLPKAQDVADKLDISVNAVYVSRQRVRDIMNGKNGGPRRVVKREEWEAEREVQEVVQMAQSKLAAIEEREQTLAKELDELRKAKAGLTRVTEKINIA
jgi:DNA-binding CsgD family transcriptional regulator